jgi:cytidylate kinase
MSKPIAIAIDGPAASGKSTLAQALAERMGYLYFDTGAMYRAVTMTALNRGVNLGDEDALEKVAREIDIELKPASVKDGRLSDIFIDGVDSTFAIRTKDVDNNVSAVSAFPRVRKALTEKQRAIGERGGVVMAGRDIGTFGRHVAGTRPQAPCGIGRARNVADTREGDGKLERTRQDRF